MSSPVACRQTKIDEILVKVKTPKSSKSNRKRQSVSPASSPENKKSLCDSDDCSQFGEYVKAKHALHLSKPLALPCREEKINQVREFIRHNVMNEASGSMYISGAPGTGKTAVVQHVISELQNNHSSSGKEDDGPKEKGLKFLTVFINCMGITSAAEVYNKIHHVINTTTTTTTSKDGDLKTKLTARITSKRKNAKPIVLVLDEMDQLLKSRGTNEFLYTLFEWTRLEGSKLTLIGIANSLDLTVRHLPLLSATSSPKTVSPSTTKIASNKKNGKKESLTQHSYHCKEIQFTPYERPDIEKILESRMKEVGSQVFDPTAIKFVAAKVAASTGDMRKALNACQAALDAHEKSQRPVLQATADDGFNSSSPKKGWLSEQKIGIAAISKVLGSQKDDSELPLQQKIILGTLLKIQKNASMNSRSPYDGVKIPIPVSKFYDEYRTVCAKKGFSWIDRSELTSVCSLLEDRSLIHVNEGSSSMSSSAGPKKSRNSSKTGIFFDPQATDKLLRNDPIVISIVG